MRAMTARIPTCVFNEYCGHGAILRAACGVSGFVPIRGRVQHGWSPIAGGMAVDRLVEAGEPMFFWSERARAEFLAERPGYSRAHVIGAPFLYMRGRPLRVAHDRILLTFPFHGTVERPLAAGAWTTYATDLASLGRRLGATRIIVCLYDLEWRDGSVAGASGVAKDAIVAAGLAVTTLGPPMDADYLVRFMALVEQAAAVVASRPCTALFYAAAMGRPVMVQPDSLRFTSPDRFEAATADEAWGRARFPALYRGEPAPDDVLWHLELGADAVLPPDRLFKTLYGWTEVN